MMQHKYLPRVWGVVLGLGGAAAVASLGCSDATGPAARGPALVLSLETPAGDSLAQLAVGITVARSDSARLSEVRVYIDSGTGSPNVSSLRPDGTRISSPYGGPAGEWTGVVGLPGAGRHTVTVVGVDTAGGALSASAAWTVRLPGEAYTVAALPDSGFGGGTRFVHANGTVTGWVVGANGRARPALWRGNALTVIALPDSFGGVATRVNAAGDVLLEYAPSPGAYAFGSYVRVRRADGATLVVGPNTFTHETIDGGTQSDAVCCGVGADLTESRLALGSVAEFVPVGSGFTSAVLDVARGARVDSMEGTFAGLNDAGQSVGAMRWERSTGLIARGFKTADLPAAPVASVCDPVGRYSALVPIDLGESAGVLASFCGSPVWLPPAGGTSRWLDRVVGRSKAVHLSRTGQIIASLDSAAAIYLWRPAANRTTQVQIAGDAWRIDALAAVNASGQIAAHGVERATGRAAALLLTPAPPAPR